MATHDLTGIRVGLEHDTFADVQDAVGARRLAGFGELCTGRSRPRNRLPRRTAASATAREPDRSGSDGSHPVARSGAAPWSRTIRSSTRRSNATRRCGSATARPSRRCGGWRRTTLAGRGRVAPGRPRSDRPSSGRRWVRSTRFRPSAWRSGWAWRACSRYASRICAPDASRATPSTSYRFGSVTAPRLRRPVHESHGARTPRVLSSPLRRRRVRGVPCPCDTDGRSPSPASPGAAWPSPACCRRAG